MAINFGQIGNALSGVGANLQGRGLEFAQQQNQQQRQVAQDAQSAEMFGLKKQQITDQRQRLGVQDERATQEFDFQTRQSKEEREAERQKTLFIDARVGLTMFKQGNLEGLLKFGESRLAESKNFPGVNFDNTQQVVDLTKVCMQGDPEGCKRLEATLQNADDVGVAFKILDEVEVAKPRIIKAGDVSPTGQITTEDPITGEFIAKNVKDFIAEAPTLSALEKNLKLAKLEPGSPEYINAVMTFINKPQIQFGAGNKERAEIAKVRGRQFERLLVAGENAESMLQSLDDLDAIDVTTGALEPWKVGIASVLEGFGVDASALANIDNAQALDAASNRMVNTVLNAASGPQTDQDANRAKATIKSLEGSELGNEFKSNSLRAITLRTLEQRDFVEDFMDRDDKATFSKARKAWNTFKRNTPSLSGVVKNPATGLPFYFYQFKEHAKSMRPGISDQEIITAWRDTHAK